MTGDLDDFLDEYRRSVQAMADGDPEPVLALLSERDDVSLANPLGPPAVGRAAVVAATRAAAANFAGGSMRADELARYATTDLACVLEIEHFEAVLAPAQESRRVTLRVTSLFRRESGGWRLAHRHADPLTELRPVTEIVEDER